jgi:hypothetical protein
LLKVLERTFGPLPEKLVERIRALSVPQFDSLTDALQDFHSLADLHEWLDRHEHTMLP